MPGKNFEGLEFLRSCTNDELEFLVDIITDTGSFTESLTKTKVYRENYPNHKAYVDLIQKEIIDFGYNSLNIFSDRYYKNVVKKVYKKICEKEKIYNPADDLYTMEDKILGKVFNDSFNNLTEEDRRSIFQDFNIRGTKLKDLTGRGGIMLFVGLFKAGGFGSYKMSVIVANSIARVVTGKGLTFAVNAGLTKALSVFLGPIALLMAAWTAWDIAGPAYRVIGKAVPYIAALRHINAERNSYEIVDGMKNSVKREPATVMYVKH